MSDFKDVLKMIETEIDDVLFGDEKVKTEEGDYLSAKSDNLAVPEVHAINKLREKKAAVREKGAELKEKIENSELAAKEKQAVEKSKNSELAAKEKQAVEKIREKKEKIRENIDYDMLAMPEVHWKRKKK